MNVEKAAGRSRNAASRQTPAAQGRSFPSHFLRPRRKHRHGVLKMKLYVIPQAAHACSHPRGGRLPRAAAVPRVRAASPASCPRRFPVPRAPCSGWEGTSPLPGGQPGCRSPGCRSPGVCAAGREGAARPGEIFSAKTEDFLDFFF